MSNLKITEYSGEEINQKKIDKFWETQDDDSMLGVDVSKYTDPKFNHSQMEQIQYGLEAGVADVPNQKRT